MSSPSECEGRVPRAARRVVREVCGGQAILGSCMAGKNTGTVRDGRRAAMDTRRGRPRPSEPAERGGAWGARRPSDRTETVWAHVG